MVDIGELSPSWVSFQYERMPIFCYWCGLLNHDEKDCKLWIHSKGTLRKDEQQYGAWLRASTERNQKSHVQSAHSSTPTQTASVAPSETATAIVASKPPRIPAAVSTVTREKETAETTTTVSH